ncbi:MAG TPA: hypothetical protein VEA69_06410 [Tepidisphaeraceae bacterium]|nr:hypothetical protein [Tepidisphaeraceae bacterium]
MERKLLIGIGVVWTVGLVMAGLWMWQHSAAVVARAGWENASIGAWAVRCMAVALVAAGQGVVVALVVDRVYARRDAICAVAKVSSVLVFVACTASAIALGLAGR